jgi:threonylcarbamoyladenosine tRNA methylthiotransferase MtaB
MKKFYIKTLGCKVNQYEAQAIRERFEKLGLREVGLGACADFCVVNTCTVTQSADKKSRYAIRQAIRENKNSKVIVTGCMSKNDISKFADSINGIDYIIPKSFFADGATRHCGHTRAFVKIQDGCNFNCSFCKVSLVRGRSRSRTIPEILGETERIVERGFKEIVLTGVCLGSFGLESSCKENLVKLIDALEAIPGLERIRLSSIEPKLVTKQLIELLSHSNKLCHHLHIPLQSADNAILKAMNRHYNCEEYIRIIDNIRNKALDVGITTDVIVGFPGEERSNFENTLKALKVIKPLAVHRFAYSPRDGTLAARNLSSLPRKTEVDIRMKELKVAADEFSLQFRNIFKNKELNVLVEEGNDGRLAGYSSNYIWVDIPGETQGLKKIFRVKITEVKKDSTQGKIITDGKIAKLNLNCCAD